MHHVPHQTSILAQRRIEVSVGLNVTPAKNLETNHRCGGMSVSLDKSERCTQKKVSAQINVPSYQKGS